MKSPTLLRQSVHSIVRPLFKQQGLTEALLFLEWKTIIGPEYADFIECEKIKFPFHKKTGGTMVLLVEKSMAVFIQHAHLVIIEKINSFFGYQAITHLTFKQTVLQKNLSPKKEKKINVLQHQQLTALLSPEQETATYEALKEMAALLSLEKE